MLDKQVAVTPTPPSKSTVTSTTKACFLSESYYDYYDVRQGPPATAPAARYDYSCGFKAKKLQVVYAYILTVKFLAYYFEDAKVG